MANYTQITNELKRDLEQLSQLGFDSNRVYLDNANPLGFSQNFMKEMKRKGYIGDSATSPNTNWPAWNLTYYDTEVVDTVFGAVKSEELGVSKKYGSWANDFMQFKIKEPSGKARPYSDLSNDISTEMNYNFETRQVFRFQTMVVYGDLQVEQAAQNFVNYVSDERVAAAELLRRTRNDINFSGIAGQNTYGILNDPNYNTNLTPANVGGNVLWSAKEPNEIIADIGTMISNLRTNSGDNIDSNSPLILSMSPTIETILQTKVTTLNLRSVSDWLKMSYPNIKIVTALQFATSSGQLVQLMAEKYLSTNTRELGFGELYRPHRVVYLNSSQTEKISASSFGAINKLPWAIVSMLGV